MTPAPGACARLVPMELWQLPQVMEVETRAYEFPWSERHFRDCIAVGYAAWVLLDAAGAVLGYALMSMAAGEAQVLNLCVDPPHQRRGHGRRLMDHLLRIAQAAGCELMLLEVRESNQPALRLYEAYGFRPIGLRKGYYRAARGREHALVLSLALVAQPLAGAAER